MVSDGSASTASSTVLANATQSLDGTVVTCKAGGVSTDPLVGNITINVVGMFYFWSVVINFALPVLQTYRVINALA